MKLDSESPYKHTCPHEHASKVIVHNDNPFIIAKDNHFMIDMLKIDNDALKEGKYGLMSRNERKSFKVTDPPQPHIYVNMEDSTDSNMSEGECMEASYSSPTSEIGMDVKENFFTDKVVTKVELPEMIVCIKDDTCHIVKDISVDERVRSEKSSVEKEEVNQIVCSIHAPDTGNNDLTKDIAGTAGSHDLKYALDDRDPITIIDKDPADPVSVRNDSDGKCSTVCPVEDGDKLDMTESIVSNIEITEKQLPLSQEANTNLSEVDLSSLGFNDQNQAIDRPKNQVILEESTSASTAMSSPSKGYDLSNGSNEIPSNPKVPSGVITFNFDSEAASTSGREENKENTDSQQSEVAQNSPATEEAKVDGSTGSARCSFLHLIQGDSNFSGPAFLSGPIANSGHIPYSGSISFRSDSSTTSARSFAFPILQSEWNSSPVKMAKADRRRLRKQRGWRMGLLCCRF